MRNELELRVLEKTKKQFNIWERLILVIVYLHERRVHLNECWTIIFWHLSFDIQLKSLSHFTGGL